MISLRLILFHYSGKIDAPYSFPHWLLGTGTISCSLPVLILLAGLSPAYGSFLTCVSFSVLTWVLEWDTQNEFSLCPAN